MAATGQISFKVGEFLILGEKPQDECKIKVGYILMRTDSARLFIFNHKDIGRLMNFFWLTGTKRIRLIFKDLLIRTRNPGGL